MRGKRARTYLICFCRKQLHVAVSLPLPQLFCCPCPWDREEPYFLITSGENNTCNAGASIIAGDIAVGTLVDHKEEDMHTGVLDFSLLVALLV